MSGIKGQNYSHKEIHEPSGEQAGEMGVGRERRGGKMAASVKTLYVSSYSAASIDRS